MLQMHLTKFQTVERKISVPEKDNNKEVLHEL